MIWVLEVNVILLIYNIVVLRMFQITYNFSQYGYRLEGADSFINDTMSDASLLKFI